MKKFDITPEQMTDSDLLMVLNEDAENPKINYSFSNFLEKAKMKTDMKMMFGSYFQTGELCLLAGKTGVGKSILAYMIADGISKGIDILNQTNETEPQKVLYYDFELNERHIKKRFFNFVPNANFLRPDITEIILNNDGNFDFEIISNDIDVTGAKVIIIDNISAIALKSLQDQDTALNVMKGATNLKRIKDVSILIVAHTPKLKENRPLEMYDISGSSHIHNFVDNAFMIGKSGIDVNYRYIKQVKARSSEEIDRVLTVSINNDNWLHFDYVGFDKENNHLQLNIEKEEKKIDNLVGIAEKIFHNSSGLSYTDFCSQYANQYGKTFDNGKKVICQLISHNLIIKNGDGKKYILNENEIKKDW